MKKLLLLIALLLPALFVTAQGIKNGLKEEPKINVGIKGGFNSSMYFIYQSVRTRWRTNGRCTK